MNNIRDIIGNVFQSPMQNMSFVAYFSYVNEAGKITARSIMDVQAVILTVLEEQEKKNAQNEANFKEIEGILAKLVEKKVEKKLGFEELNYQGKPVVGSEAPIKLQEIFDKPLATVFECANCGKALKTKLALAGHSRSHKPSPVV